MSEKAPVKGPGPRAPTAFAAASGRQQGGCSARGSRGPAAVPPRPLKAHHVARAAGRGPGAASGLRLRTASQRRTGFRETARGEPGKIAPGGGRGRSRLLMQITAARRGLGAGPAMQSRVRLGKRRRAGGAGRAALGLFPRVSDVADVSFKSGRAGAVRRNANLGCYTTAGVRSRRPPGSQSASPPPSPPQPFGERRARSRRRFSAPPGASGGPRPPAQAGPDRLRLLGALRRPPRSPLRPT